MKKAFGTFLFLLLCVYPRIFSPTQTHVSRFLNNEKKTKKNTITICFSLFDEPRKYESSYYHFQTIMLQFILLVALYLKYILPKNLTSLKNLDNILYVCSIYLFGNYYESLQHFFIVILEINAGQGT